MKKPPFKKGLLALVSASAVALSTPAAADDITRADFTFPDDGTMKIVVFRPDVSVGSQKVSGLVEPNAEWTETARANIQAKMVERASALNADLTFIDELEGEDAELLTEYRGLFEAVSSSIFTHVTVGDKLATKTERVPVTRNGRTRNREVQKLDWTLGPGTAQLKEATGADYAMFVFSNDAYGDSGRKAAQVAGMLGCIIGVCVTIASGVHVGYAGLVELETGNIVWFNTDLSIGGDPREVDGAEKRVRQLMEGFPLRDGFAEVD
ncbi:hypothetical protein INR77_05250 [Erythrobacter sp. SCSIO 43205]|uniref:hypothetical protein n=1 Tax=Erythrobacter sp. SCSIO 43205 TaxID=2779361 RepID=UPI001CA9EC6A|nr:hypothetical protein [Erythrobacter sp. SCSIO 43205]UAB79097.1 hypothetical protein INR77_05250 [Erythrobacter sp. SCSIO 43205]